MVEQSATGNWPWAITGPPLLMAGRAVSLAQRAEAALVSALLGHRGSGTILWLGQWTTSAAVLLGVIAVWTYLCYRREGRPSLPGRLALTLLRLAAAATLLVVLFEPTLRTERVDRHRSTVAVLVDRSDSMSVRDRWTDPAQRRALARWAHVSDPTAFPRFEWARRALGAASHPSSLIPHPSTDAWLRRLSRGHAVRLYAFAGERRATSVVGLGRPPRLPVDSTRLGDAIGATLDEYAGQPLAGIVVLSDGGSNRGEDPVTAAARAGERRVPVFTVGIGDPTPPRDLAVASLMVDEVVRKGDEVPVVVGLKHTGIVLPSSHPPARPPAVTTRVTLREDGRTVATRMAVLTGSGQQEVQFPYRPARAGTHTLQVTASPIPGEITLLNNTRSAGVRVIEKRLRILYVEGSPRWEYRYLKNAILRDPSVKLACLLTDSEPSPGGEGNLPISGFPTDRKALFDFDVVILGDVARASFSDSQLALLRAFVEERGGSLLVIAGEAHMPWEYHGTPLEELLPAAIPPAPRGTSSDEPFSYQLTQAGAHHPMMQLEADPVANLRRWDTLPGGYWHGDMARVKPGATVLLEATGRDAGRGTGDESRPGLSSSLIPRPASLSHPSSLIPHPPAAPLVLLQPVGEGMTVLSLVDSTWRWRFRLGDTYFYRYWGQVIRTLTPHELPGDNRLVRVTVDRESYEPGERVVLRARALTPTFHPLRAGSLLAGIVRVDGTRIDVRLNAVTASPGVYSIDWAPPQPGSYRVVVRAPASGAVSEARFTVRNQPLEQQQREMNRDLLEQVAQAGGGRYLELTDLNRLPGSIPDRAEVQVIRTERPLWDTPLPLAIFSLFLVGEWVFRKRAGLL